MRVALVDLVERVDRVLGVTGFVSCGVGVDGSGHLLAPTQGMLRRCPQQLIDRDVRRIQFYAVGGVDAHHARSWLTLDPKTTQAVRALDRALGEAVVVTVVTRAVTLLGYRDLVAAVDHRGRWLTAIVDSCDLGVSVRVLPARVARDIYAATRLEAIAELVAGAVEVVLGAVVVGDACRDGNR
jgi:hypothetical protein